MMSVFVPTIFHQHRLKQFTYPRTESNTTITFIRDHFTISVLHHSATRISFHNSRLNCYALREGTISVASVRPSVRLSVCQFVAYTANNSRTQRPSVPKFGMKVPHLRCHVHFFNVKRSPSQSLLTHILWHIFQYEPTTYSWLLYFLAISVSICTKLTCSILMRDRNIAVEPNL